MRKKDKRSIKNSLRLSAYINLNKEKELVRYKESKESVNLKKKHELRIYKRY